MAVGLQCSSTTVAAPPQTLPRVPLVQEQDLVYTGAFRLPGATSERQTFNYGGTALTYWPAHDSLLAVGHDWYQMVAEFSTPTAGRGTTIAELPQATLIQPLTDILQGKRNTVDGDISSGVKIGGMIPLLKSIVVSAWTYYDAGSPKQTRTHFVTGQNFSALTPVSVTGPFQVGTGFQDIAPSDTSRIGGFVSGYMAPIPQQYQAAFGGTHLTGQGGFISIITRTSSGPSATVFSPSDLGVKTPAPATILMGYPADPNDPNGPLHHPTLGEFRTGGGLGLHDGTQGFRGMVFPDGTRSILFYGWGGTRFCYGTGTANRALDLRPVPSNPGTHYCYDPTDANYGTHGYPHRSLVFAYDANDFIAVKQGQKRPWDVRPYATWTFSMPFQSNMVDGVEMGIYDTVGATYDPATRRVFVSAYRSDASAPLIHVFILKSALTLQE